MKSTDFLMSEEQLADLNSIIGASRERHINAGEDSLDGISVIFDFSAFGRSISVRCSGGPTKELLGGYQEAGL
jgi:hypothetical protein